MRNVIILTVILCIFCQCAFGLDIPWFEDVKSNDWYFSYVNEMYHSGILIGTGKTHFSPEDTLSRGMMVTVLGRVAQIDPSEYNKSSFADVLIETWYGPYAQWAYESGLTVGTETDLFSPDRPLSREEMAVFLLRFADIFGYDMMMAETPVLSFADKELISHWAVDGMEFVRLTGIMVGDEFGNCNPGSSLTRAEAAAMVCRFLDAAGLRQAEDHIPDLRQVIHAGGEYHGMRNSNSLEAMVNTYQSGHHVIELDFNFTSDGYLVCVHDWQTNYIPEHVENTVPTLEWFLQGKVYGSLTSMWIGDVAAFLEEHPDAYIVTDIKEQNLLAAKIIARDYPEVQDQFIIQLYSESEYGPVRELGFENIIFTLYMLTWNEKMDTEHWVEFARSHELLAYTFPAEFCGIAGYVDAMRGAGVPLLIHTINDKTSFDAYYDMGVYGIYTDLI